MSAGSVLSGKTVIEKYIDFCLNFTQT